MAEEQIIKHEGAIPAPYKIKLIKGQKDSYGWEISVSGEDSGDIMAEIAHTDMMLRRQYGGQGS